MNYLTVTLNPAIDKTYLIDALDVGELNRLPSPTTNAGGKGINSARMLAVLGEDVTAMSLADDAFRRMTSGEKFKSEIINVACGVRTCTKLIDSRGVGTELNERGGPVTPDEFERFAARYRELVDENTCVLLGGSSPQGVEKNVYNFLIKEAKLRGATVAIDCDGEVFRQAVSERPHLVKPNAAELGEYFSTKLSTIPQVMEYARKFYTETGIEIVSTVGGKGAVYVGRSGEFAVNAPKITVRGFAGAGDSFLAAFVSRVGRGERVENALRYASAVGAAKAATEGTSAPTLELVEKLYGEVELI